MSMTKHYLEHDLTVGPGGWKCPCCNPYYKTPRKAKPLSHRATRRHMKQELHQEVNNDV